MPNEKAEPLTASQKEQLEAELAELEGPRRAAIVEVQSSSVGGVSPAWPVGRALLGAKTGDEVEIDAPSGSWRARVISVGR